MNSRQWFESLAGRHAGATAVVLATGPSLADLDDAALEAVCRGRVVFAVKQALLRFPRAHYHVLNPVHWQPVWELGAGGSDLGGRRPVVFSSSWVPNAPLPASDYHFEMRGCGQREQALVVTRAWDRSLVAVQHERQWGPGIVFELVVPLAIHFGVRRLIVAGWDLAPPGTPRYRHAAPVPDPIDLYPWETAATIAASGHYYRWLKGRGVELELLSRRTHLSPDIPRRP